MAISCLGSVEQDNSGWRVGNFCSQMFIRRKTVETYLQLAATKSIILCSLVYDLWCTIVAHANAFVVEAMNFKSWVYHSVRPHQTRQTLQTCKLPDRIGIANNRLFSMQINSSRVSVIAITRGVITELEIAELAEPRCYLWPWTRCSQWYLESNWQTESHVPDILWWQWRSHWNYGNNLLMFWCIWQKPACSCIPEWLRSVDRLEEQQDQIRLDQQKLWGQSSYLSQLQSRILDPK